MAWFLENPGTGLLPKQDRFKDLPCKYVTYCMYNSPHTATQPYRKLTWIATNVDVWRPVRVCTRKAPPGPTPLPKRGKFPVPWWE
jgi:hypothetical protein